MPWLDGVKLSDEEVDNWMKGKSMSRQFYGPSAAQDLGKQMSDYIIARLKAQGAEPTPAQIEKLRKELLKTIDTVLD